jgi:hypothetical protein
VKKSPWLSVAALTYLAVFVTGGIYTLVKQVLVLPFPFSIFMDYNFYSQALMRALSGGDMYSIREIGEAFLYPPPSLLFVEILHLIPDPIAQGAVFAMLDFFMAAAMVYLVCKKYSISLEKTIFLLAVTLTYAPLLLTAYGGQINMLTGFGLGLLFIFGLTNPWLAGLGLALAIVTKMTPLYFLLFLLATKNFQVLWRTALALAGFILLGALRYGLVPFFTYIDVFRGMTGTIPTGAKSQALSVLLTNAGLHVNLGLVQLGMTVFLLSIILLSSWQTWRGGPPEALFIITAMAMLLSPNILWYHHYVFFLLPLVGWITWQNQSRTVLAWCLAGMLIIQFDYFLLTGGLLVHFFGVLSILAVLFQSSQRPGTLKAANPELAAR